MKILDRKGAYGARPERRIQTGVITGRAPELNSFLFGLNKLSSQKYFSFFKTILAISLVSFVLAGCENSMDKIKTITKNPAYPTVSRINTEIFYSDSSRIKIRVWAPKLERYTQSKEPYMDFPEGILVYFYDTAMNIESEISARTATYYENKKLWIARNDVVAKNNNKGEQLNTEELFWDQVTHKIYSEKFSRIQSVDGVFIGEAGFDANEKFTWWKLKSSRGTVNMKDEQ